MKTIILTHAAARDLDGLPIGHRRAIENALFRYATTGNGDVKQLQGRDGFRMRVGNYRVIFDEDRITILAIYRQARDNSLSALMAQEKTMTGVQIIKSPNGDELVVIPRAEYEALLAAAGDLEDEADIAIYDARKTELADDPDAIMPQEVSDMILRGHTRLKAIRTWRGLAQSAVAAEIGIAQGYLSDLESGRKAGSLETLTALAKVFDVPVNWLR